jgi:hypothetical protein
MRNPIKDRRQRRCEVDDFSGIAQVSSPAGSSPTPGFVTPPPYAYDANRYPGIPNRWIGAAAWCQDEGQARWLNSS